MATMVVQPDVASPPDLDDAQAVWALLPIAKRLQVLRRARFRLAASAPQLVAAISPELARTEADSYAAEMLPLLAACRFLEKDAEKILAPRRLGRKGLPFWLAGIESVVERVAFGSVLVIGPANYPLFLPGVQVLQALAAGNAVVWKPGRGGRAVAEIVQRCLLAAGLPEGLLCVTGESIEEARSEIAAHPDKIFFTGSSEAGREVLRLAAETAKPVVAELSGCDAVIVLPSAELNRVVEALTFGMRLNGSATCMAPRRLILVGQGHDGLIEALRQHFAAMDGIEVPDPTYRRLHALVAEAEAEGARVLGGARAEVMKPLMVLAARPEMRIAQADLFAPILSVMHAADVDEVLAMQRGCPLGLTAAIFGSRHEAEALACRLGTGTVLVNDLIVPTADPRVPFGGRGGSGFGVTRGREGLLEMTAIKVTAVRTNGSVRHFQPTSAVHAELFRGAVRMSHSGSWRERWAGLRLLVSAARKLK